MTLFYGYDPVNEKTVINNMYRSSGPGAEHCRSSHQEEGGSFPEGPYTLPLWN